MPNRVGPRTFLLRPGLGRIAEFLAEQSPLPLTYAPAGMTRGPLPPPGFVLDRYRTRLGTGHDCFAAACTSLRNWEMFHLGWVEIRTPDPQLRTGNVVGVLARCLGLWWLNSCRIVYTVEESTDGGERFGFAYGTLPGHVECGEERFLVECDGDGSVSYDLLAISRPAVWYAVAARAWTRALQRRFAQDSLAAMRNATARIVAS